MRRRPAIALLLLAATALPACSGDEQPVVSGADEPTTAPDGTAPVAGLAIARCEDIRPLTAAAVVDGPLADDEVVAAAQAERAGYGLPSDEAATREALAAGPSPELQWPMTAAEEAEFLLFNTSDLASAVQSRYEEEPWFAGVWIDNVGRTTALATTDDAAALQAEVDSELGAGTVQVVTAERSVADLEALQGVVQGWVADHAGQGGGSGQDTDSNVVSVFLEVLDPAVVSDLAEVVGADAVDGLCVGGADPAEVIPAGPQPEGGEGWRLLADEPGAGAAYDTGFAATPDELAALWVEIGLDGEPPAIDFTQEVVVWFGPAVSGSCSDVRLDDVVLEGDVLRPEIVLPGGARSCTDDANPHAYVVTYERARLPERFTISVAPNEGCCPDATTEVELGFNG